MNPGFMSIPDQQLSDHFWLSECVRSQQALRNGIDNTPTPDQIEEMRITCVTLLEPGRALLGGHSWHLDSGIRCPRLNVAVNGSSTSAHLWGGAADVIPAQWNLRDAFDVLRKSELPYDQIIIECGAWIHLGRARNGATPRRQMMVGVMVRRLDGSFLRWDYQMVA